MNIEKVVRVVEQSVSGVRVKVLNHCYAELEELKVVFDCASPIPEFCDKVTGLMEKARFHNTHAYVNDDGDFTMIFARATSFGVEILEREAKRSRNEQNRKALERLVKQGKATIKLERGNCRMKKLCRFAHRILHGQWEDMLSTRDEIEKVITPTFEYLELKALCRHLAYKAEELGVSADDLRGADAITALEILFDAAITKGREE